MKSWKSYEQKARERCIKLFYGSLAEKNCWKKTLEDEGYNVTKATTREVCYEEDEDEYDPDVISDIDCECSGCRIYQ